MTVRERIQIAGNAALALAIYFTLVALPLI